MRDTDGAADCDRVEPHYYRKAEFIDEEGEVVENEIQVNGMLKSYQRILEAGRAINQRVTNVGRWGGGTDPLPYYDLTTFLDDGKEKKVPVFGKEANIMYHLKNEGYRPYSEDCEACPACYTQDVGEDKYYDMMIQRCMEMHDNLPEDWDGVYRATTK